ncbi:hypothetical protein LTR66_014491, partial [Elasticomyces elasticus]
GRPTGTPMNKPKSTPDVLDTVQKKRRKRAVRERDLCDVKIKITEFFSSEELENMGLSSVDVSASANEAYGQELPVGGFNFVMESGTGETRSSVDEPRFGVLESSSRLPEGHPGAGGRKWYLVQRVNILDKDDGDEPRNLDHKHTLEESDRIKKNSVQRWLIAQEKEKRRRAKGKGKGQNEDDDEDDDDDNDNDFSMADIDPDTTLPPRKERQSRFHATGSALRTLQTRSEPASSGLMFFGNSFCPFAQRVWIALELIGVPYQYVECTENSYGVPGPTPPRCIIPELLEVDPEGHVPCIRHNNFAIWESAVILEYLEDLAMGHSLFVPAVGNPQLKAHSRLWANFIDRRILPIFYVLLMALTEEREESDPNVSQNGTTQSRQAQNASFPSFLDNSIAQQVPQPSPKVQSYIHTLSQNITSLVNASHRTGPFFLGTTISFVDIALAPWIIRLGRVLEPHYPILSRFGSDLGARWQMWVDAIEKSDVVQRTVSDGSSYQNVYTSTEPTINRDGVEVPKNRAFAEARYARRIVNEEGFGLGGDIWGPISGDT